MKKMMKTWALVAAAAMGLTACQNDYEEQIEAKDKVVVSFLADAAEGRTSVNTEGDAPEFAWDDAESFAVLEQTDKLAVATDVYFSKKENGSAEITAAFDYYEYAEGYKYVAVYPETGYVSGDFIEATLTLPAEQTMVAGSYDPAADLMVSKVVATDVQPTEIQPLRFTRLAAVAKMSFRGIEAGEKIESVTFAAEGKTIAGNLTASLETPYEFTVAEGGSNSVTVNAAGEGAVYFTLLPTTLNADDSYTVTVITDKKIYVKEGTIAEGKTLQFAAGMVTRFGVDLTTATPSDKWVLVRDVNALESGDIVTFVSKNQNWVIGKPGSNYYYASYTEVVKMGDYFFHPIAEASEANNRVQQFVVAPRPGKENAFEFYNRASEYNDDTYSGYICTYSTNNYIRHQTTPNKNSLFYTTIDENGVATLEATDSEFANKKLKYRAYDGGTKTGDRRFGCTKAFVEEEHDDICIYKIAGGVKGVVPTAKATVTVPDEEEPVVIVKEGVAVATTIDAVTFGYVGNWAISVSDNADWLTVNYADEKLTYTATANEGEVRNATVTITATHEGESNLTWTFNVVQKGAPKQVSIKEFSALGVDENTEYLVTGVISTRVTSSGSNTVLSDAEGNTANFKYIDMADGTSFYNNAANTEGNVVTILASKSYSSYGGSSSAHSICQGYYNITAKATKDFVEFGGGSVEISIEKEGTLQPGTINGSVDGTFAELATNGDKYVLTLKANEGAPRQAVATFTDGYDTTSVTVIQAADTSKGNTWELVTDASTLAVGDQVIIAAKDYDVAMSTTISSSKRSEKAITKLGNRYLTPALGTQTFVLGAGSVEGTFVFYDDTNKGFLVSSNTSAELINQAYTDDNTAFAISIEDGTATIGNKAGDYSTNTLAYYYNSSTKYFCSIKTRTTYCKPLSLYRLVGVPGTIPVVAADITAEDAVISDAAATTPTAIPEVVFNYVGDWNITATSEAEWLTSLSYDKAQNCLTYTAEANEGTYRTTTVTITATHASAEAITWKFELLQKGYTPKMTIAEYRAIPEEDRSDNIYARYEMTGRIESIENTSATNCKFTITDETDSVQVYGLETEDGSQDYGDFGLKVGDVVTITAPRIPGVETAGKGSANPAYYISHYNIEATATAAEYGAGSTATISVTTTSGLDVTYEMVCDFATIDYSADSSQENTTAIVTFTSQNDAEQARSVDVTFRTGMAYVTVTVSQGVNPIYKKGWCLVYDVNELKLGDKVIIAAREQEYAISSTTSSNNSPAVAITKNGDFITSDVSGVQQYVLESGHASYPGTWGFKGSVGNTKYIYASSGKLITTTSHSSSGYSSWTISIDSVSGEATIVSKTSNTKNTIMFNNAYSKTFNVYTSTDTTKEPVCIYKYYE